MSDNNTEEIRRRFNEIFRQRMEEELNRAKKTTSVDILASVLFVVVIFLICWLCKYLGMVIVFR